jgi:hypothetical protein
MGARNILRLFEESLEQTMPLQFGGGLKWLPASDDPSNIMQFGDGTTDFDFKIFMGSSTEYIEFDVGNSRINCEVPIVFGAAGPKYNVAAKATSYTVLTTDFGSVLTTRGASGTITFTLPASSGNGGAWVLFLNCADQTMEVAGADEELVVFNDLTADKIGFAQSSEKIGGMFLAICDGTSWVVAPIATETQTIAVTSA